MAKTYLATKSEVTAVAGDVETINTQINTATTGVVARVTALEGNNTELAALRTDVDAVDAQLNTPASGLVAALGALDNQVNQVTTGLAPRVTALEALSGASGGPSVGDSKFSYKTADHDGWYVLNGRNVSTLSVTAQASAATLGWTTTIPNTQGRYTIAASPTITSGTTGGSSFIARSALPNVTLSGTTVSAGSHTHTIPSLTVSGSTSNVAATSSTSKYALAADTAWNMDSEVGGDLSGTIRKYPAFASTTASSYFVDTSHSHTISGSTGSSSTGSTGSHTHTFTTSSINGGVTQTSHLPTYSAKTEFVFLGL
jgi:hypothetical protein